MINFVELKRTYDLYACEYEEAVLKAMRSGWYIMGKELSEFERQFASYVGSKYCIGINSGLDALILAVRALGIKAGDEVIVPSNTYIASVLGITENGATPVFVEPDEYFGIDAEKIESAITEKTKAILPVHLYGQACDMTKICSIAGKHNLMVIEDCAQSHGATYCGKMTGTFGDIGCFSFYPTKPLGALGDSGAIVTDDEKIAKKLFAMRNYGSSKKYVNNIVGVNSRLDELQAAALQVSLKHVDDGVDYRNRIARRYLTEIKNTSVILPKCNPNSRHVYHVFALLSNKRNELQKHLFDCGISSLIHYPIPPHLQKCYTYLGYHQGDLPICEKYASCELSLPIYNGMPHEEVSLVINAVNSFKG